MVSFNNVNFSQVNNQDGGKWYESKGDTVSANDFKDCFIASGFSDLKLIGKKWNDPEVQHTVQITDEQLKEDKVQKLNKKSSENDADYEKVLKDMLEKIEKNTARGFINLSERSDNIISSKVMSIKVEGDDVILTSIKDGITGESIKKTKEEFFELCTKPNVEFTLINEPLPTTN